nr:TolC family protein [uncultured Flavobacterium sp.]
MKYPLSILTVFLLVINLQAQEVKKLTIQDALVYALENKADAKKAKLKVENSEYQIQEVRSRALPQISANGSLTYNPILQTNVIDGGSFGQPGTTIQAVFGQKWNSVGTLSLTQALFDQSVFTGLKAAKSTREFYQINEQLTEEQVIEAVANNYYQIYVLRQKLTLLENTFKTTEKARDIVKGQFENGLAKKIDLDRMNVRITNVTTQKQQIENLIQLQENTLKFFIGMPISTKLEFPNNDFKIRPVDLSAAPNPDSRTEIVLLKKQEELLNYQKKAALAGYYPTLSLAANYNYIGQGPEMPWFKKPADGVYWSDFSSVTLNLRIPIFTGFGTKAKVSQADVELRTIQEDIKDTQLAMDLDYKNANTQIVNSTITITNQKENMLLAEEILKNTNNNYLQGLASLTDLLDAENAATEAQNNYTSAILDYILAEIKLIKSKGELKSLLNN